MTNKQTNKGTKKRELREHAKKKRIVKSRWDQSTYYIVHCIWSWTRLRSLKNYRTNLWLLLLLLLLLVKIQLGLRRLSFAVWHFVVVRRKCLIGDVVVWRLWHDGCGRLQVAIRNRNRMRMLMLLLVDERLHLFRLHACLLQLLLLLLLLLLGRLWHVELTRCADGSRLGVAVDALRLLDLSATVARKMTRLVATKAAKGGRQIDTVRGGFLLLLLLLIFIWGSGRGGRARTVLGHVAVRLTLVADDAHTHAGRACLGWCLGRLGGGGCESGGVRRRRVGVGVLATPGERTVARLMADLVAREAVAVHGWIAVDERLGVEEVGDVGAYLVGANLALHVAEERARLGERLEYEQGHFCCCCCCCCLN